MRIILAILITIMVFMIYKIILTYIQRKRGSGRSWYISILDYIIFMTTWVSYYLVGTEVLEYKDWEIYLSLNLIGIFSAIWMYFSIEVQNAFMKPRIATQAEQRVKKILVYSIVFLFILFHGYQQTRRLFTGNDVNESLLLLKYSVVVVVTSLDRILNQVIKAK